MTAYLKRFGINAVALFLIDRLASQFLFENYHESLVESIIYSVITGLLLALVIRPKKTPSRE